METWKRPRAGRKVGSPATSTFRNSAWRENWQQCDDWDGEVGVSLPGSVSWTQVERQPTSLSSPRSRCCCCDHPPAVPPAPSFPTPTCASSSQQWTGKCALYGIHTGLTKGHHRPGLSVPRRVVSLSPSPPSAKTPHSLVVDGGHQLAGRLSYQSRPCMPSMTK